jgi:broad-specificity NMP kinase
MKIVFIYGPPGVGKLTTAKELAKLTGYRVLHNHLTVDLVTAVFDFRDPIAARLVNKYRLDMVKNAAEAKVNGLILTMSYARIEGDDKWIKDLIKMAKTHKSIIYFVQLYADKSTLEKRIKLESRRHYKKIKNVKLLNSLMAKYDLISSINFVESLKINNQKIPAKRVAKEIKRVYRL